MTAHDLKIQADVAQTLLAHIKDIIGDDEEAALDAIEGETNFIETVEKTVERLAAIDAMNESIGSMVDRLGVRQARLKKQSEQLRTAICVAMEATNLKKLELGIATVSRKTVPPKCEITSEADVPSQFWKPQPPRLDKKAVLDALKAKEDVPGAVLGNGQETVAIRFI